MLVSGLPAKRTRVWNGKWYSPSRLNVGRTLSNYPATDTKLDILYPQLSNSIYTYIIYIYIYIIIKFSWMCVCVHCRDPNTKVTPDAKISRWPHVQLHLLGLHLWLRAFCPIWKLQDHTSSVSSIKLYFAKYMNQPYISSCLDLMIFYSTCMCQRSPWWQHPASA